MPAASLYEPHKRGDLAVTADDTTTADQHHRAALTIAEQLMAADPGNAQVPT